MILLLVFLLLYQDTKIWDIQQYLCIFRPREYFCYQSQTLVNSKQHLLVREHKQGKLSSSCQDGTLSVYIRSLYCC